MRRWVRAVLWAVVGMPVSVLLIVYGLKLQAALLDWARHL